MNGEHPQVPAAGVLAIDLLQACLVDIVLEDLPDAVLIVWGIPASSWVKYVGIGLYDPVIALAHDPLLSEHTLELIGQPLGQGAGSRGLGFGVLGRKKDCASAEADVPDLDLHELTYPAAQLIDHFKHQLVRVIVHGVEELLELIEGQITDDLAETFVSLCFAWPPVWVLPYADGFDRLYCVHVNVKSLDYKNLPARNQYTDSPEPKTI
jgi:hypothetical protein